MMKCDLLPQKRNINKPTLLLAFFFLMFLPDFLLCQSTPYERVNLGLYGGASLDFACDTNHRLFSAVSSPGTLFYSDDTCKTWTQAFPIDSLEYQSNQRGWSGGRRVLTNRSGWVGVQTAESGGTYNSSVISYEDGDSGTFKTAFDNYLLKQIEPAATMQHPEAIYITDHWFYVAMDNYLLRTNDTSTLGAHNIVLDMDTSVLADTSTHIQWISVANTPSGFPILLVVHATSTDYCRLLKYDGITFSEIAHPTLVSGTTYNYYFKEVFSHPMDTTMDTIIVSCNEPTINTIKVFRSLNGGGIWTDITPSSGVNWPLQNTDYSPYWESIMPQSNGLRLSFAGGEYSDDLGTTWTAHILEDNAVAFYPINPNFMIGSKNKGPILSTNGGTSFSYPNNEGHAAVSITKIAQLRKNTYYVATKAGLGYTTAYHDPSVHGVDKWRAPYGDFPIAGVGGDGGVSAVDIDPNDSLHIVVGYNAGFYISTTGPAGFTEVHPADWDLGPHHDDMITDVQFITSDTIVACSGTGSNVWPSITFDYGNVWVSTNGGNDWTKMHPSDAGVDFEQGNTVVAAYGNSNTTLYIGTGYWDQSYPKVAGAIWKSEDFGQTWNFVNYGPHSQATGSVIDSMPIFDMDVYPGSIDTLYFASGQNLDYAFAKSTDGGITYSYINNMVPEGNFSAVMVHPDFPNIVSIAARRDLWRTDILLNSTTLVFEGLPGEFVPDLEYGSVIIGTNTGLFKLSETPGSIITIWNGTGDWSDASKWSNGVPYDICDAIIESGAVSIDIDGEANALSMNPGTALTIELGKTVTLTDKFLLESDETGYASFIDNGTLNAAGTVHVQRNFTNDKWHYFTPPISDATAEPFLGNYVKWWDETISDWIYIASGSDPLLAGKGYASWSTGGAGNTLIEFIGTLNTGDYSPPLSLSGPVADYGWNLVGNDFPSAFDWNNATLTKTGIDNTIYYWTNGGYVNYNPTTGGTGGSEFVPAMQGFFIHANDVNPVLTVTQDSRLHDTQAFYGAQTGTEGLLRIDVSGFGHNDENIIMFKSDASNGFDPAYDAYKLFGDNDAPQLYSYADENLLLTANVQPFDGKVENIPLGLIVGINGEYTLSASGILNFADDMLISLEDTKENQLINLRSDSVYTFTANHSDDPHRFILHFDATTLSVDNLTDTSDNLLVYMDSENVLHVKNLNGEELNGALHIYDILGRQINSFSLNGNPLQQFKAELSSGTYIVMISSRHKTITKRVFIK